MEKRILSYRKFIDSLLAEGDDNTDWKQIYEQHLIQVGFFQHERLIHLIVTVTFAILEIISIALFTIVANMDNAAGMTVPGLGALCLVLFILLIPYIRHYWILENEVQKMYRQHDKLCLRCGYKGIFSEI